MKKWSGDHCAFDYQTIPGVADLEPQADGRPARAIIDIAPTVLKYFGVPIPKEIDGKPLF